MQLNGIHHVTAVSAHIADNVRFYTQVLGLRLVKKSVNQDDVSAYHLFYADKVGSPGTDMTFFDWPKIGPDRRGTDSITATAFRVNGQEALEYWAQRLYQHEVEHHGMETFDDRAILRFQDPEGQRLMLVDDGGAPFHGVIWDETDVPADYAIRGFYGVMISVPKLDTVNLILTQILNMKQIKTVEFPDGRNTLIYAIGEGGVGRELWVMVEPNVPMARMGAGGVHHVAFRVSSKEALRFWRQHISSTGLPISDFIDRYYFESLYFRISNGILFEIATDGPGFATDEDLETLGERLALPPFLEPQREQIEAGLKPLD